MRARGPSANPPRATRRATSSVAAAVRRTEGSEEAKDVLAIELKARGRPLSVVARELRCSMQAARERIDRVLAAYKREVAEGALALDAERLDRILEGLVAKGAFAGKVAQACAALKVIERRAKYFGLDAAQKHEHTGAIAIGPTIFIPPERPDDAADVAASGRLASESGPPN